ncbi:hypothetical protein DICPUDRAFT_155211 [Dictyostelium purpureum]|uniref:WW domain-containing protein n=1 Tax=Dictyostelium purpureum TaxID=5786 RepID=F0ZTD1_DICPU|nr:uncharacterized protein DICPUDRAFT_155211 [Dictyostelium purpureum]EGC32796.1 hypothetical protein DICPUDRAFT_155211 [Dictyostelium purpureum]|eukprot:XP_003290684.1 hypothetical protein DICPUDRAFT_155211 [Dictyostelium purpureum]
MMNNNPQKLPIPPQPWSIVSDNMGRYFYYNPLTQQQSWTPPPGSTNPPTAIPIPSPQPQAQPTLVPQFNIPLSSSMSNKSLPDGWEESTDSQGRVYYIDHINKKTSWIHPSFSHTLHQPVAASSSNDTSKSTTATTLNNNLSTSPPSDTSFYPSFTEYGYNNNSNNTSSSNNTTSNVNKPPVAASSSSNDDSYRPRNFSAPQPVKVQPIPQQSYIAQSNNTSPQSTNTVSNSGSGKFCDACSTKRIKIPQFNYNDAVRVCEYCFSHQSSNEKTCISRLVPYLFENYKNTHQQYQALLEIYDYVLTYQNYPSSIEAAIVGGLKPFLEYATRATRQGEKGETVALCCQIMAFTSKYEKVLKSIGDKENLVALFDLLHATENPSVQIDSAKVIKEILIMMAKKKSEATSASPTSTSPPTTTTTTNNTNNTATTNNEPMIPNSILAQFIGTLDQPNSKNKEDYQIEALKIMKRLVQDENTAIAMAQSGAIEVTTPLLSSNKQGILRRVLKLLLTFIEYDQKNSEKIFSLGGALFLSELLLKQISPNYNIYILTILNSISKTKFVNNISEIEGLVDLLLEPFNNVSSKEFKELLLLMNNLLLATTNTSLINKISTHPPFIQSVVSALMVPSLEQSASQCLLCLSQGEKVKEKLRDLGVIDPLLSIICDKSKNPIGALKILTGLAKNNESICNNIFEVGGLTVLIDIITAPAPKPPQNLPKPETTPPTVNTVGKLNTVPYSDVIEATQPNSSNATDETDKKIQEYKNTQYQAVKLLSILSYSKNIIREFVHFEGGNGVKTLVSLMNPTCDDQIKEVASESLCNLCEDETCAILVISEGGLTYAQALLSSNQTLIKANTLKLIQKLATHSPDIKIAISEGTSIQKIVEMLSNSNPELKKCAIFSLAELCRENASNRDLAYKCGCLPHLINSFNTYTSDTKTLVCILEVLAGFSQQSDQYRAILLGTDIVQSIIEYLFSSIPSQTPTQNDSNNSSFIIQSQVYSVLILSNLIKENANDLIRKVIDSGIILSLIPMLAIKNSYLQEYTLNTLKIISKSTTPEIRETMIFSGILNSLSDLLFSKNESILTNSLYILVQLSQSQDCGGYLLSTNAVTQISELVISPSTPEPVKKLAIQLISTLFETSSNNSSIWETFTSKAGIPGLVSLLSSNNYSLAISAAGALSQIVVDGPGRARVVENGGLPLLLKAMSSENIDVACASLVTVLGLSLEDELCEIIVNLGGLKTLEEMILSESYMNNKISIDTKLYACETVFNLASNAQCRARICEDNQIISQIISCMLLSNNDNYQAVACKTLALITDANTAKFICEQGAIFCLVPLLSNNSDINTKISSSITLTNLAKLYHPSRSDILDAVNVKNEDSVSIISVLGQPLAKNSGGDANSVLITSDIRLKLQILELLELLSDDPTFPEMVEKSKGISTIVSLLTNVIESEKPPTQEEITCYTTLLFKTLSIITYLTHNASVRSALLKNDFLKQLGSLMTPPPETLISLDDSLSSVSILDIQEKPSATATDKPNIISYIGSNEEKEELNKLSLSLIYTLALSEEGKHAIRNSKLVNTVARFIDSKNQDQICFALRTISLLALSSLNRLEIYNNGGLEKVLNQFNKSDNPNILLNSLSAIYNLIFLEQSLACFIQKDSLKNLVNCILYPNETIQHQALLTINRHFNNSKYIDELVEKYDIVGHLVNILNNASSESLILYVLKTLNDFIPFDSARISITTKIPVQILKTLQNVNNPTLRELASSILELFSGLSNITQTN